MIFLRHPRVAVPDGLCYGRLEVGLAETARGDIAACLASLPRVAAVVASPQLRCRALADQIAARDGVSVRCDVRLMEYHFGAWEGLFWADIPRDQSEPWTADILNAAPPGGERFTDLIARVGEALGDIPPGTAVVAHAGPIRAARMLRTGASFDTVFADTVPYCTPVILDRRAA